MIENLEQEVQKFIPLYPPVNDRESLLYKVLDAVRSFFNYHSLSDLQDIYDLILVVDSNDIHMKGLCRISVLDMILLSLYLFMKHCKNGSWNAG